MPTYRGSWYSQLPGFGWVDKEDRPGSNALGVADAQQGIALPSRSTLGQWFNVTAPNGQTYRLQQTDVGPAGYTGRGVDISAAAAQQMGYTPKTFPTDGSFKVEPTEGGTSLPEMAGMASRSGVPLAALATSRREPVDFTMPRLQAAAAIPLAELAPITLGQGAPIFADNAVLDTMERLQAGRRRAQGIR